MLISFEGLDNCGKTTIVGKLKKYYDGLNILTDFTREFETNIGREIKEMSKAGVLDPVLKTYLFAADRYIRTKIYEEDKDLYPLYSLREFKELLLENFTTPSEHMEGGRYENTTFILGE